MVSDKSLEMNNFADSKYITKDGFHPKKSYNKIVNLNLLTCGTFWHDNSLRKMSVEEDQTDDVLQAKIQKSMEFYSILKYLNKAKTMMI